MQLGIFGERESVRPDSQGSCCKSDSGWISRSRFGVVVHGSGKVLCCVGGFANRDWAWMTSPARGERNKNGRRLGDVAPRVGDL